MSENEISPTSLAPLPTGDRKVGDRAGASAVASISAGARGTSTSMVSPGPPHLPATPSRSATPALDLMQVKQLLQSKKPPTIGELIGEGSTSRVYLGTFSKANLSVYPEALNKGDLRVAVKEPKDNSANPRYTLKLEESIFHSLKTIPNVVQVLEFDMGQRIDDQDYPRLYLEYIAGATLESEMTAWAQEGNPGPGLTRFLDIATDIARVMRAVHKTHILRGLKPAKIMIDSQGTVRILGYANATPAASPDLKPRNFFTSTLQYLAPELTFNADGSAAYPSGLNCGLSVDVYAYGVILWQLASRKFAYKAPADSTSNDSTSSSPYPYIPDLKIPQLLVQGLKVKDDFFGRDVCELIKSCLAANAQERPSFSKILSKLWKIRAKGRLSRFMRKVLPARLRPSSLR